MSQPTGIAEHVHVQCAADSDFVGWLSQADGTLIVSTYQAGKVAMIGYDGRQVTLLMRQFDKPLGLSLQGDLLALATRHDVTVFANAPLLAPDFLEDQPGRYDALFLPRASYHTGDLHIHDVAFQGEDVIFVNTRFSCLARVGHSHNFVPVWKPAFVSDLVPEDRCHLNGLAMVDGKPKYVTALGATDAAGAWRSAKATGGVVIDVESREIVRAGMSMPHSPRWHDGRLWVENSGTGELWVIDPSSGQADVVCGLPGYLRGLAFVGPFALVGLCKIREKHIFGGLPIQDHGGALRCGVAVIDVRRGAQVGMFEFTGGCEELYDVQFLPGARRPMILNLEKPAARQAVTHPESSWWLRPSAEIPLDSTDDEKASLGGGSVFGLGASVLEAKTQDRRPKTVNNDSDVPAGGCLKLTGTMLPTMGYLLPDSGIEIEGR
jgi:uncharacterized protein (TIGR03032 family)